MPSPQTGTPTTRPPQTAPSSGDVDVDVDTGPASKDAREAPTTPSPQRLRSSSDLETSPASMDASESSTTPPPPIQRSGNGLGTSSGSKDALEARTTPPPQTPRSSSDLETSPASMDASEASTTPPPPIQRSRSGLGTSSGSKGALEAPTTPRPQTLRSNGGLDTALASKDGFLDQGFSSGTSTIGGAAAPQPSSRLRGGSPSTASRSPSPVSCPTATEPVLNGHEKAAADTRKEEGAVPSAPRTAGNTAASPPPSPRRGGSIPTALKSPASVPCPAVEEPVTHGHDNVDKAAADTGKEERVVPSVMDQITSSHALKMAVPSGSKQQNRQKKEDLDLREEEVNQWEEELDRREQEVEQREEAATKREKRQYDRWLHFAEWESDLRHTHYDVQHGHARLSKWLKEADADWTDRVTAARRMEDEVRCEKLRLKAKEEEEKNKEEKGKGKVNEDEEKEEEDEKRKGKHGEKELSDGCFGSVILPWNYGRRARGDPKDMSSSALNETLLTPQQSKPMPTPSGAANPRIADATAMTMRTSKPKAKVYQFETRLMVPRFQRPTTYNVGACPGLDQSTSGRKDPQMVKITLCVLTRPAENFSERDLVSTIRETLKAVIAQYNASQLINESELVSWEIRQVLTERTRNFGISIDNVSIMSLSFEKQLTHDTEETKQMTTQEAEQESRSAMIKSQEDDQIWNKRQLGYIFDLSTALGLIFLIRPLLPAGYDRCMLVVFAAVWGVGSVGLPVGLFGTSRFEKNWSRHVGRFISLCCSVLVIYGIYILALRVSGAPELTLSLSPIKITDADANADWWMTVWFSTIAVLVLIGHLYSWIRGCCTGGDRDNVP